MRIADPLPYEREHFAALKRMRMLESYYRWTFDLISPFIGRRVLDAGCGVGNFTHFLGEVAEEVVGVDLSLVNIRAAQERFAFQPNIEFVQADLSGTLNALATCRPFDTVTCLDVLEHLPEDMGFLRHLHNFTAPGGHLIIKVPACPWLYGSIDAASGHYRRYTPLELRRKAEQAGWDVVQTRYMNIAGVIPYFVKSRVLRQQMTFSNTFSARQLYLICLLISALRKLDTMLGPPIGQSAILIARNK